MKDYFLSKAINHNLRLKNPLEIPKVATSVCHLTIYRCIHFAAPKDIAKPKAPPEPSVLKNKISSTTMVVKLKPLQEKVISVR